MTNILEEAKRRPKLMTAGVTAASVIGFFFAWDKLSPTLEFTVKLRNAPAVADAALQKATEAREWIDEYIRQQKEQQALEQQRYELEQEFKKKLWEMQSQQQQIPNQRAPSRTVTPQEWQDPQDGSWWCCTQFCDTNDNWYQCE